MAAISTWSKTPASNNAAPPDGWPEGQPPSSVNDCAREMMAQIRTQWEDAEWFNYGDVPTRISATKFSVPGDQTANYIVDRRIKSYDASTLYGAIAEASLSAATTNITLNLDGGSLTASLTAVALAIIKPTNTSLPAGATSQVDFSVNQVGHGFSAGNILYVTGAGAYDEAQADAAATAESVGIVHSVADADNFTVRIGGRVTTGLSGMTPGAEQYLSTTAAGGIQEAVPTTPGHVIKHVMTALTATTAVWVNNVGIEI
jgi:hypothetical protein